MARKKLHTVYLIVISLLILSSAFWMPAETGAITQPEAGSYMGAIEVPGMSIEVRMQFSRSEDGSWQALFDFPQQQLSGLAATAVEISDEGHVYIELQFTEGETAAEFSGDYDPAAQAIAGDYYQDGMSFPFTLVAGDPAAAAHAAQARLADLSELIPQWMDALQVPGAAVGVIVDGQTVFSQGFGLRDVERQLPVTPETRFHIASTTKTFTTALLAQLVDEGVLDWDTPVIEYTPDFALFDDYATAHATLRDLAAHRVGLARHDMVWLNNAELDRNELFAGLSSLLPAAEFRSEWRYCNLTFAATGVIAERVTGQSWEELVAERLLGPLEMESTTFDVMEMEAAGDFAKGYRAVGPPMGGHSDFEPIAHIAAPSVPASGSMQSNVPDMLKWLEFQLSGRAGDLQLLSTAQLRELHLPQMHVQQYTFATPETPLTDYGLGWFIQPYRGYYAFGHSGIMDGCTAEIRLIPELQAGLVVLCNAQMSPLPAMLAHEISDRLLNLESSGTAERMISIISQMSGQMGEEAPQESLEAAALPFPAKNYLGRFEHPAYGAIVISLDETGLRGEINGYTFRLAYQQGQEFILQDDPADAAQFPPMVGTAPLAFELDDSGNISGLTCRLDAAAEPVEFVRSSEN